MGKTVRRKRKSRIIKRKTRVKKRRSRIKKRKAHFKRRRTRVKKRKFINKKTRRKKRRTIQKGGGLGFKDLFMALSAITASLSGVGATPMLERTQVAVDLLGNRNAVFCAPSSYKNNDNPLRTRFALFKELHSDKNKHWTDEQKSKAAEHITHVSEIYGDLKNKVKTLSGDTCLKLATAVGPVDYEKLIQATDFIKEQHGVEDENTKKEESDENGNKSDDPEKPGSFWANAAANAVPFVAGQGVAHAYGKYKDQEALVEEKKLAKAKEAEEKKLAKAKEAEEKKLAKAKEAEAVTSSFKGARDKKRGKNTPFVYRGNIRDYYGP